MKQLHIKSKLPFLLAATLLIFLASSCMNNSKVYEDTSDIPATREMIAELTSPPNVPTPVGKRKAKKLIVNMEILEEESEMTDGVKYVYWTFGGSVPGSFIRTRVGDEVEFHLINYLIISTFTQLLALEVVQLLRLLLPVMKQNSLLKF